MANEQEKDKSKEEKDKNKSAEDGKSKKENEPKEGEVSKELSTKKIMLLMSIAFLVILVVTIIILVMVLRPSSKVSASHSDEKQEVAAVASGDASAPAAAPQGAAAEKTSAPVYQAQFIKIEPSFIVNFTNNQNIKFLEVSVTLVAKTDREANQVKNNMPYIKDQLVTLFSAQKYEDIKTQQGRDLLRTQALTVVQDILEKESGGKCVTDILFTSFVMQ